jgi:hypothetical protein
MSAYLDKSKNNLSASQLLITQTLPDASIHCSYYAVVQQMLHVLFIKMKIDRQGFEVDRRLNKEGTHGYAEKLIRKELKDKDYKDFKWFQWKFPELKKQREEADYFEKNMTNNDAEDALIKSKALINLLTQNFK